MSWRRSSGSMRAARAVELTKSENTLGAAEEAVASTAGGLAPASERRTAMARFSRRPRRASAGHHDRQAASHGVQAKRRRAPSGSRASNSGEPSRQCRSRGRPPHTSEAQFPQPIPEVHRERRPKPIWFAHYGIARYPLLIYCSPARVMASRKLKV